MMAVSGTPKAGRYTLTKAQQQQERNVNFSRALRRVRAGSTSELLDEGDEEPLSFSSPAAALGSRTTMALDPNRMNFETTPGGPIGYELDKSRRARVTTFSKGERGLDPVVASTLNFRNRKLYHNNSQLFYRDHLRVCSSANCWGCVLLLTPLYACS